MRRGRVRIRRWAAAGGIAAGAALLGSLLGSTTVSAMDPHYRHAAEARAERERFRRYDMPGPTRPAETAWSPIPHWDEWAGQTGAEIVARAEARRDGYDDPALLGPARDWEEEDSYAEEARAEMRALEERIAREEMRREAEVAPEPPTIAVPAMPVPVVEVGPVEPVMSQVVQPLQ